MTRSTPPRFVTRTLVTTLATVAFVLSSVLLVVALSVRDHVRRSVIERLETGQRLLVRLEQRRQQDLPIQVATIAESPTLRDALDTYRSYRPSSSREIRAQLVATVERELEKVAVRIQADVLAVRDTDGNLVAVAGRRKADWGPDLRDIPDGSEITFITVPSGIFRAVTVPVSLQETALGSVQLAQALGARYASELSVLAGVQTLIVSDGQILATTLPEQAAAGLTPERMDTFVNGGLTTLDGEEYAVRPLLRDGTTAVYVLDSIDASARPLVRASLQTMIGIGLGAFLLAAIASLWLARTISRPINTLSNSITDMTRTRTFDRHLAPSGASVEVDSLTDAFNTMTGAIITAEAETLNAYLEDIRALAMALDARDPYTAGHSERVSALSVAIGREMGLDAASLEVLRLGALLHDIGKIGVSDHLLRKPLPLTTDEYEVIKTHPTVGSRILRNVRFLDAHLPIVELHHERPDGCGYPYGLQGDAIPVHARIVHVADAYDAMTSARAYRPAMPAASGLSELTRCAGTDFDPRVVRALAAVISLSGEGLPAPGLNVALEARRPAARPSAAAIDPLDEFTSEGQAV